MIFKKGWILFQIQLLNSNVQMDFLKSPYLRRTWPLFAWRFFIFFKVSVNGLTHNLLILVVVFWLGKYFWTNRQNTRSGTQLIKRGNTNLIKGPQLSSPIHSTPIWTINSSKKELECSHTHMKINCLPRSSFLPNGLHTTAFFLLSISRIKFL